MNMLMELRQRRQEMLDEARQLITTAEAEDRDLSEDEAGTYDGLLADAESLEQRARRLETLADAKRELRTDKAPAVLKHGRGDSEMRAQAHFLRTGDAGALAGAAEDAGMGRVSMRLTVPTQRESRAVVDSSMNITTDADGGYGVPTGLAPLVAMRKNERMLAENLGLTNVPGVGTTVNFPTEAADPEVFADTSEQADDGSTNNYERAAYQLGLKAFTLAKKTRKLWMTEEILEDEDVSLISYVADKIGREIAKTHNSLLLTEVGSNGSTLKTFASATAIAAGEPEDIVYSDTLSYYLDDASSAAWVMRPSTFGNIASITGSDRLYAETPAGSFQRSLLMYPVWFSNQAAATAASAKDVYFGDWSQVGYREGRTLRIIVDPYSVDGIVVYKYSFRVVYGVLQSGGIGFGEHPSA